MNFIQAVLGCMLFAVASLANAGFLEGLAAYKKYDYETAMSEWRPLAEQGDADAQFFLGVLHGTRQHGMVDYKEAAKWYRLAAEQDDAAAQLMLGYFYSMGRGVPQDYKEASAWFSVAAEKGFANAAEGRDIVAKHLAD